MLRFVMLETSQCERNDNDTRTSLTKRLLDSAASRDTDRNLLGYRSIAATASQIRQVAR